MAGSNVSKFEKIIFENFNEKESKSRDVNITSTPDEKSALN